MESILEEVSIDSAEGSWAKWLEHKGSSKSTKKHKKISPYKQMNNAVRVRGLWGTASGTRVDEIPVCCCLTGPAWLRLDVSPNLVPEAVHH